MRFRVLHRGWRYQVLGWSVGAVILLSGCDLTGPAIRPTTSLANPEIEGEAAAAAADFRTGCYVGFKKALEIYRRLYVLPSARKDIAAPYLKALLLTAVRERDLGILNDATLDTAESLVEGHASLAYFVPYIDLVRAMPPKTRGIVKDIDVMAIVNILNRTLKNAEVEAEMRQRALKDEGFGYLYVALHTGYASYLHRDENHATIAERYPDSVLFKYAQATTYPRQDSQALAALALAEPDFYEAYYSLGEFALGVDMPPDLDLEILSSVRAEDLFLKAAAGLPESAQIMVYLGGIHMSTEEFEKGIEDFDRAVALAPAYRDARLGKAICLTSLGRHREAIDILNGLINEGLYLMGESYYWLARNYHELRDRERAEHCIEESKGRLPTDSEVYCLAGTLALESNMLDKAEKEFIESLRFNGRNVAAVMGLAEVNARQKKWLDSATLYEHAIKAVRQRDSELAEIIKRIQGSRLEAERKKRILVKKEQQRRALEENEATACYEAAVGYANGGQKVHALEMGARAAAYPQFREAAEKLMNGIR
jgi:tetratricopeptide (TPR) repeat protein